MAAAVIANRQWAPEVSRSFRFSDKDASRRSKRSNDASGAARDAADETLRPAIDDFVCPSSKIGESKIKDSLETRRTRSPKVCKAKVASRNFTQVKPSALLYEITERTNRLAQPRAHKVKTEPIETRPVLSRIPEPTERILELSKPKRVYTKSSDGNSTVAPSALRAIATKRIIELSKPRKKRKTKLPKKKEPIYAPCSPRIVCLSRPKRTAVRERADRLVRQLLELTSGRSGMRSSRYARAEDPRRRKSRRATRKRLTRRSRSTNSDRTVITIDLDASDSERFARRGSRRTKGAN